jgi:hypothetical protein
MGGRKNREWLDLLQQLHRKGQTEPALVVVLTNFPENTWHEAFHDYRAADVLDKSEFRDEEFGDSMRQLVEEKIPSRRDLEIAWAHGPDEAAKTIVDLKIRGWKLKPDSDLFPRVVEELEDLLCRLFWKANRILVTPLPAGHSGARVVKVDPIFPSAIGTPVAVKFGDVDEIDTEHRNYKEYVEGILGGSRATFVTATARTRLLRGICYSLLGADEFEPFETFYERSSPAEVRRVLDSLFKSTCVSWYKNIVSRELHDLAEEYRTFLQMTPEELVKGRNKLTAVHGGDVLQFQTLKTAARIRNPIRLAERSLLVNTYACPTHGDLNGGNILIDAERKTWLIDFMKTGIGHLLRDYAFLDTYTRCILLRDEVATLDERLLLERSLPHVVKPDVAPTLPTDNAPLRKAFETSLHIRALAAERMQNRTGADMQEYDVATMFYAMNLIRFYTIPSLQRQHGLLAAGLIAERLGL